MADNKIKFRTVCAWCNRLISEEECSITNSSLALSQNGVMISHGLCDRCRKSIEVIYGINKNKRRN